MRPLFTKLPSFLPPLVNNMDFFSTAVNFTGNRLKDKVIVIMGPTGSGKSKLSIDLASRFPGEVINSDKIQVYKGLNITTNKMPFDEQLGVTHHLLGEVDSVSHGEFTPSHFRSRASNLVSDIISRGKVPYIVGGSNSFIYALLSEKYDPEDDVFSFSGLGLVSSELRYNCCFIWVDVSLPVLNEYLKRRVDEMIDSGMVDELSDYFQTDKSPPNIGLRKSIGIPEFERYCNEYSLPTTDSNTRRSLYEEAIKGVKENTCRLAKRQVEKIQQLRNGGWDLHKIDGTDSFRGVLEGSKSWSDIWERQVIKPSVKIVKKFLEDE